MYLYTVTVDLSLRYGVPYVDQVSLFFPSHYNEMLREMCWSRTGTNRADRATTFIFPAPWLVNTHLILLVYTVQTLILYLLIAIFLSTYVLTIYKRQRTGTSIFWDSLMITQFWNFYNFKSFESQNWFIKLYC